MLRILLRTIEERGTLPCHRPPRRSVGSHMINSRGSARRAIRPCGRPRTGSSRSPSSCRRSSKGHFPATTLAVRGRCLGQEGLRGREVPAFLRAAAEQGRPSEEARGQYRFTHLSLQEYFSARSALSGTFGARGSKRSPQLVSRWQNVETRLGHSGCQAAWLHKLSPERTNVQKRRFCNSPWRPPARFVLPRNQKVTSLLDRFRTCGLCRVKGARPPHAHSVLAPHVAPHQSRSTSLPNRGRVLHQLKRQVGAAPSCLVEEPLCVNLR